jgi:hypothetical protein
VTKVEGGTVAGGYAVFPKEVSVCVVAVVYEQFAAIGVVSGHSVCVKTRRRSWSNPGHPVLRPGGNVVGTD